MLSRLAGLALLAAALVPAPARALDPAPAQPADLAEIEACLAGANDRPEACIGAIANRCQSATPDGATTPGIAECAARETAAWDRLLNTRYAAALAQARQADDDLADGASPGAEDSLKTAQRAWVAFRDAECGRLYQLWRGGTIRSPVAASCQLQETARRAIRLSSGDLANSRVAARQRATTPALNPAWRPPAPERTRRRRSRGRRG